MTRAALTKVVFLVIIAFILCLPEFFTVQRVSRVSLSCVWCQLCGDEEETGVMGSNSACPEQWQHLLRAAVDQRNVTQTDESCFVCQGNVTMPELDHNSSSSDELVDFEVSLTLLLRNNTSTANLTLFGYSHDFQSLHLSDREEAKAKRNYASLCCPPSADDGANHSRCLLLLSNRTFARGGLPWKRSTAGEWRCVLRVAWLSLLGAVLLLIVITVTQQIIEGRKRISGKSKIHPFDHASQGQHFVDRAKRTEVYSPTVLSVDNSGPYSCSALSSIEEVETSEEAEVFFS